MEVESLQDLLNTHDEVPGMPSIYYFEAFFPWIFCQLETDATFHITRTQQVIYRTNGKKDKAVMKSKIKHSLAIADSSSAVHVSQEKEIFKKSLHVVSYADRINLISVYDHHDELVELKFIKNEKIPPLVFQAIALIILPYYRNIMSLTVNGGINRKCIIEMSKYSGSSITELCLDGARMFDANFDILLEEDSNLVNLSLARCKIDDQIVKKIARNLVYPLSASKTLSVLNLASNVITDKGAKYLSEALKSNRHLVYLNLAGNWITDDGAEAILDVLSEFKPTPEELKASQRRYMQYCENKLKFITKIYIDRGVPEEKKNKKKKEQNSKKKITKLIEVPTKTTEDNKFEDPFSPTNTFRKDDVIYCYGNNSLAYINLSYNNVTYFTAKKLLKVLIMQRFYEREPRGLINVALQGNPLPKDCPELRKIDEILFKFVDECVTSKKSSNKKIKSMKSFAMTST